MRLIERIHAVSHFFLPPSCPSSFARQSEGGAGHRCDVGTSGAAITLIDMLLDKAGG